MSQPEIFQRVGLARESSRAKPRYFTAHRSQLSGKMFPQLATHTIDQFASFAIIRPQISHRSKVTTQ